MIYIYETYYLILRCSVEIFLQISFLWRNVRKRKHIYNGWMHGKGASIVRARSRHPNNVGWVCLATLFNHAPQPRSPQHLCLVRIHEQESYNWNPLISSCLLIVLAIQREIENLLFCSSLLLSNYIYLHKSLSEG